MPNFALGSGRTAMCNFPVANSYADDYRNPAALSFTTGSQDGDGFDESEGTYTLRASGNQAVFIMNNGSYTRHNPRFRLVGWTSNHNPFLSINDTPVTYSDYIWARNGDTVLMQYFGTRSGTEPVGIMEDYTSGTGAAALSGTSNPLGLDIISNPVRGSMAFQVQGITSRAELQICNLRGAVVKSFPGIKDGSFTWQNHGLANGLYIARLRVGEKRARAVKFIVIK